MKANMPMGTLLSLIGLRMKISRRREVNQISEGISDDLLMEILKKKPQSMRHFLKVKGSRKEIWHYFGDLIVKSLKGGLYGFSLVLFSF